MIRTRVRGRAHPRSGANATMRPLDQEFIVGEPVVGDSAGHVAWTQELARVPLLVGTEWRAPNAGMSVDASLVGPSTFGRP